MALIALGVTGGIGAYKAVEVCRGLQKRGPRRAGGDDRAPRGGSSAPLTFEAITRHPVITSQWRPGMNADIEHIAIADHVALLLVAPCTANVIGKFANGIADDFLTSLYLATQAPVLAGAGDELEHAGARGRAGEPARRCSGAACGSSSPARDIWRAAGWARAAWPSPTRSSRRPCACWLADRAGRGTAGAAGLGAARPQGAGHRRADLRGHRPGALRRQPVERAHGVRARGGSRAAAAPR